MSNNTLEVDEVIFRIVFFSFRNYFFAFLRARSDFVHRGRGRSLNVPLFSIFLKDVYSSRILFKNHYFKSLEQYTEYGPTPLWVYLIMIGIFAIGISLIYFAMKKPRTPERMSLLNPILLTTLLASFYALRM